MSSKLPTVISVSGGQSSAYLAANYPSDSLVFALVRTASKACQYKDRVLASRVEDLIQAPFIGTLEDDKIIQTIFDLEQYIGKKINWVTGPTFDAVIQRSGGNYLPNRVRRFCTEKLKVNPIFYFTYEYYQNAPILMSIGYRAGEQSRKESMLNRCDEDGYQYHKATFEKHTTGRHQGKNKWVDVRWRKVNFPLIDDGIDKQDVKTYWKGKPVAFATLNNCIGCFHRSAQLLAQMAKEHPEKYQWFEDQEEGSWKTWKPNVTYSKVKELHKQMNLFEKVEPEGCNSGFCGF